MRRCPIWSEAVDYLTAITTEKQRLGSKWFLDNGQGYIDMLEKTLVQPRQKVPAMSAIMDADEDQEQGSEGHGAGDGARASLLPQACE